MPFINVYIHLVWSTKYRNPYLDTFEKRNLMWNHIRDNANKKGIHLDFINGYTDHCHCLVSMGNQQSIQNIVQLLKGESSFWANKITLTENKFSWQEEYWAASVDPRKLDVVRNYIKNQEEHHKKLTFGEEYDRLIKEVGSGIHSSS